MAAPPFVQGWSGTSKGSGTITVPDVEPSGGPNIGLVAIITIRDAAATSVVTGVAYAGSEAFGKAHDVQYFGDARVEFWVLTGPAAASGDVVATFSGTPNACIQVREYTGVNQTTPIGAVSAPAGGTGAGSQTWTITTQHADSRIVSGVSYGTSIGTLSWTSPEENSLFIETGTSGTDNQGLMGDREAPTPGGYTISAQVSAQAHEWSCGTIELRAAGGGSTPETYTYEATGGVSYGGAATPARTKAPPVSGGIVYGGAAVPARTRAYAPAGGIVFSGSADTVNNPEPNTYTYTGDGGIVYGGAAPSARSKAFTPAGGLTFAGAATLARGKAYTPQGGLLWSGETALARTKDYVASGGLSFGGIAPTDGPGEKPFVLPPGVRKLVSPGRLVNP